MTEKMTDARAIELLLKAVDYAEFSEGDFASDDYRDAHSHIASRLAQPKADDDYSRDLRALIVCDTQFSMRGETELRLDEMERLSARGWIATDPDEDHFVTPSGRQAIAIALHQPIAQEAALNELSGIAGQLPAQEAAAFNPCAPTGFPPQKWTEAQREECAEAMKKIVAQEAASGPVAGPMARMIDPDMEQIAREAVAYSLDAQSYHGEAENVRDGSDLDPYKYDLLTARLAVSLYRQAMDCIPVPPAQQDGADARILATGYISGFHASSASDQAQHVTLSYDSRESAEAALDEIARSIDAYLASPGVQGDQS